MQTYHQVSTRWLRLYQRRSSTRLWWQVAILLLAFAVIPGYAQYRASLQGTVADPAGAMIPGAQLTLTDTETGRVLTTTSDGAGNFSFNELAPNVYSLTVSRDGFKKHVLDNVKIIAEQANAMNVVLEVGGAAETVTVNASETPLMDTETGSISGTISQNDLAKMPDFGRDPMQLARLAPGMFGDGSQSAGGGTNALPGNQGPGSIGNSSGPYATENRPQVSGNGQRNDSNGISLDGVGITSVTWGSAAVITPNPDSIKEMKVVSNSYDAEYGRFGGAQIQMISQNGTNQYHGSALFKLDRPGLNAHQRWDPNNNPQRNNARYNEFGGTFGGPILRNKVFAFFSYDTIRNSGKSTGGGWYETSSFDGQSPSGSISNKFLTLKGGGATFTKVLENPGDGHDCANINLVEGVNCHYIQGKGLDLGKPLTIGLGKQDPSYALPKNGVFTPGLGGDGTGSYAANMDGNADLMYVAAEGPNNNTNTQYGGRLDYQMSDKDLLAATVYYVPVNNTFYNGPYRASNLFHHNAENYSMGLLYNRTFSGSLLNEARADMAGWRWDELGGNSQSPLGLPDAQIQQNNYSGNSFASTVPATFGPSLGSKFDQWTLNFKDVLTKVHGSHNMKFGGQVTRLAYLDEPTWFSEPTYFFNNLWDFMNDAPNGENATADPRTGKPSWFRKDDRQNIIAFFVQDDWKVRSNVTINAGLRWEYFSGMTEKNGNEPNVYLGTGANTLSDIKIVVGGHQVDAQKGNFGPQLGFAWSPERFANKLVVRGGFGMGYNGLEMAITTNTRNNPPFVANGTNLTGSQIVYGTGKTAYTAGDFPANPNLIQSFNANNLPTNGNATSITGLPRKWHTAYTYRLSLDGQYDLGHQWVGSVGYSGSLGRHLPIQTNLNNYYARQIYAGQMSFNPILNGIDWYYDGGGSSYNALLLEIRHQFAHTFSADVQYRWSKSLDDGSGPYTSSSYQFAPGYNWSPSDFDTRHNLKMYANWSPVLFHGNYSWLEKVAGGWNFSPIFTFHSGFPWDSVYGNGIACNAFYQGSCGNGGNGSLRPVTYKGGASKDQSTDSFKKASSHFPNGGASYFTQPTVPQGNAWSKAVAPTPVAPPTVPGLGRNAFVGPRYSDLDFAVTKAFALPIGKLGENPRLEIRANTFNLFNKLNLSNVDNTITDSNFGRANNVLGARTIEMEAHFKF